MRIKTQKEIIEHNIAKDRFIMFWKKQGISIYKIGKNGKIKGR